MVCRAGVEPRGRGGREVGGGLPHGARDGQLRQRLGQRHDLDDVGRETEAVAHVGERDDDAGSRIRVEYEANRVVLAADAERVHLERRLGRREGRADLEHVRAEDQLVAGLEVVGVVLHERGAAGQARAHHLGDAHEHGGLPVALGAEAVAVGHEALHGEAGQLAQRAEVLEVGREGAEVAGLEEGAQAQLDARAVAQRVPLVAVLLKRRHHVVQLVVLLDEGVDVALRRRVHGLGQLVDGPGVDADAEADLRLRLVALGHRDVAHVVAETGEAQVLHGGPSGGGARPHPDGGGDGRVRDVTDDGLAGHAHPGLDVGELAVTMGRLVEVHEVEVDLAPGQAVVGLGVQVQQRLLQGIEPADPHLGRREGVHPRDHADDLVGAVGLEREALDRVALLEHRLPDDRDRDVAAGPEGRRDLLRLLRHLGEGLGAVEVLAAREEPDLARVQVGDDRAGHFGPPWP